MDRVSKEKRSKIMSSIKSKDTAIELKVKKRLMSGFVCQYRPAKNCDFAYVQEKIAIFVDGSFWHGKDFAKKKSKMSEHWVNHIQGNIDRDARNRNSLVKSGWEVLSFWEDEVNDNLDGVIKKINKVLKKRRKFPPKLAQQVMF